MIHRALFIGFALSCQLPVSPAPEEIAPATLARRADQADWGSPRSGVIASAVWRDSVAKFRVGEPIRLCVLWKPTPGSSVEPGAAGGHHYLVNVYEVKTGQLVVPLPSHFFNDPRYITRHKWDVVEPWNEEAQAFVATLDLGRRFDLSVPGVYRAVIMPVELRGWPSPSVSIFAFEVAEP